MTQASRSQGNTGEQITEVRRVGLVEDHESVALGLKAMLADEPDLELVSTAATVSELLVQQQTFDLVVLDLRLGDGSSPRSNVEQLHNAGARQPVQACWAWSESPHPQRRSSPRSDAQRAAGRS
jgi:DNA-binding NarL/FixJ family response regulator